MKCIHLFCAVMSLSVLCGAVYPLRAAAGCSAPHMGNGRTRIRQRARVAKFICLPGYEIIGNTYATCVNGAWDVQIPVCVRAGCKPLPELQNGIQLLSHRGAWTMFFCGPGYQLSGSSVLYCNGKSWNGTIPVCIDSTVPASTSCDFENADLCGWKNDELHDFDWRRFSKKTPSAFMNTGPSYDHTYGESATGHYMYVESTGKQKDDKARLLSPVYGARLATAGCFSFYYHMFGKTTGTLTVYIKPESMNTKSLTSEFIDRNSLVLFEKSGNQGDLWFREIVDLPHIYEDFQLVIEGVRGSSYTSDIAIDDVAIFPTRAACKQERDSTKPAVTQQPIVKDSCVSRCRKAELFTAEMELVECSCFDSCVVENSCCVDFHDLCDFFDETSSTVASNTTENEPPPQTMKLIASTIQTLSRVVTTTVATTSSAATTTTTAAPRPTTRPTTTAKFTTGRPKTTTVRSTTRLVVPLIIFKSTPRAPFNATGILRNITSIIRNGTSTLRTIPTTRATTKSTTIITTTQRPQTTKPPRTFNTTATPVKRTTSDPRVERISRTFENHNIYHALVKNATMRKNATGKAANGDSAPVPAVVTILGILFVIGALILLTRTNCFKDNLDRLRAKVHDHRATEEVRYLRHEDQLDFE